ncbi:MAG: hypothetical protein KAH44_32240, partial [Oricola sp.]|nr:hypothetical protein [Oricola sp.]
LAQAAFLTALASSPNLAAAHHGLGLARLSQSDRTGALAAFRNATASNSGAWTSWLSIAETTPDQDERGHALGKARDACRQAAIAAPADGARALKHAELLKLSGRADEAARIIEQAFRHCHDESATYAALANAHYRRGDYRSALKHQQWSLLTLQTRQTPGGARRGFDPARATRAIEYLRMLFDAAGLKWFLAAGTLLGFMREGAPLDHDRDVDVGIIADGGAAARLERAIVESDAFLTPVSLQRRDRYVAMSSQGVGIDIFLYERDGRWLDCGFSRNDGDIAWRFSGFNVCEAQFSGMQFPIPDNPDLYLAETYGNWRKPDKFFASAISSPALHNVDAAARAYVAAYRARK